MVLGLVGVSVMLWWCLRGFNIGAGGEVGDGREKLDEVPLLPAKRLDNLKATEDLLVHC